MGMRKGKEGKGRREGEKGRASFLRPHPLPSGPTCSEEVTACHSGPCLNGGSCSPNPGGYSCTCPPSHTGPHCQTSTDHCDSGECLLCPGAGPREDGGPGQGVLVPYLKKKKQKLDTVSWCSDGVRGVRWGANVLYAVRLRLQAKNPTPHSLLSPAPCLNGGTCVNKPGTSSCFCAMGFQGPHCEERIYPSCADR